MLNQFDHYSWSVIFSCRGGSVGVLCTFCPISDAVNPNVNNFNAMLAFPGFYVCNASLYAVSAISCFSHVDVSSLIWTPLVLHYASSLHLHYIVQYMPCWQSKNSENILLRSQLWNTCLVCHIVGFFSDIKWTQFFIQTQQKNLHAIINIYTDLLAIKVFFFFKWQTCLLSLHTSRYIQLWISIQR